MISTPVTTEFDVWEVLEEKDRLLAEQEQRLGEKEEQIEQLRRRIRLLEKALFGPRSERIIEDSPDQGKFEELLAELDELNKALEAADQEPARPESPSPIRRRKTRRNLQQLIPDDLPEEEIVIDVSEYDWTDGGAWWEVGVPEVSDRQQVRVARAELEAEKKLQRRGI